MIIIIQCSLKIARIEIPKRYPINSLSLLKAWTKGFGNEKVKAVNGGILQMNIETQLLCQLWGKGQFKRAIKELSQFDDKKPEELESEFDHFDWGNSYPTSHFKGRNIVDLDFVYRQLLDGHKAFKPHYPSHNIKEKD